MTVIRIALLIGTAVLGAAGGRAPGWEAGGTVRQEFQIGIVDFFGLNRVAVENLRQALVFKAGDKVSLDGDTRPTFIAESEKRLAAVTGVARARIHLVCCETGRLIVYVGIEEEGRPPMRFREAPQGTVRLPADIVQAGKDFLEKSTAAIQRGDAGEDDTQGHSFFADSATRAVQERFLTYAARDRATLPAVLRDSSDAGDRALAAQVLGYVTDKQNVVPDLVSAMSDPVGEVRNNAMRALALFAKMGSATGLPAVRVPPEPFIALLTSPVWTDRNKASLALVAVSERRDPALLQTLRRNALGPLVEMARWKTRGHAMPALRILGRIAGEREEAIDAAWNRGERETIIARAMKEGRASPRSRKKICGHVDPARPRSTPC